MVDKNTETVLQKTETDSRSLERTMAMRQKYKNQRRGPYKSQQMMSADVTSVAAKATLWQSVGFICMRCRHGWNMDLNSGGLILNFITKHQKQ